MDACAKAFWDQHVNPSVQWAGLAICASLLTHAAARRPHWTHAMRLVPSVEYHRDSHRNWPTNSRMNYAIVQPNDVPLRNVLINELSGTLPFRRGDYYAIVRWYGLSQLPAQELHATPARDEQGRNCQQAQARRLGHGEDEAVGLPSADVQPDDPIPGDPGDLR